MEPADIDKIEFNTTRVKEGYDQHQVDTFLDRIQEHWEAAEEALHQAKVENDRLKRQLDALSNAQTTELPRVTETPSESAAKILTFAQKTADDVILDARSQADELLATTRNQCDAMKNEARGTVYQLNEEAKELADKKAKVQEYLRSYLRRQLNELEESGG